MRGRAALAVAGLAIGAYGAFRLLELGWANVAATLLWLAAGVFLHDAVVAPATIALAALGVALLPRRLRGPSAGGLLVLGTVTIAAVPVLGRFGARGDNPTLLDRDYTAGWLVVAALVLAGVGLWVVAGQLSEASLERRAGPPDPAEAE